MTQFQAVWLARFLFQMVENQEKNNISWPVKIIWNSSFSVWQFFFECNHTDLFMYCPWLLLSCTGLEQVTEFKGVLRNSVIKTNNILVQYFKTRCYYHKIHDKTAKVYKRQCQHYNNRAEQLQLRLYSMQTLKF